MSLFKPFRDVLPVLLANRGAVAQPPHSATQPPIKASLVPTLVCGSGLVEPSVPRPHQCLSVSGEYKTSLPWVFRRVALVRNRMAQSDSRVEVVCRGASVSSPFGTTLK